MTINFKGRTLIIESDTWARITLYNSNCEGENLSFIIEHDLADNGSKFEYSFKDDGYYIVRYEEEGETNVFEEMYPVFENLLLSIIDDMKFILCGCGCKDPYCDDCEDFEKEEVRNILVKLFTYIFTTQDYLINDSINDCLACTFPNYSYCLLMNEDVYGNSSNMQLFKRIVAFYYLSILQNDITQQEVLSLSELNSDEYFNEKYEYFKVSNCIKNLGINCELVFD